MNRHDLHDLGGGTASGLLAARAAAAPGNLALVFRGQETSYRALDAQASAVAAGLVALGFAPGEASATFMTNRPEFLFSWLGASRAGLVQVPVNTAYKAAFLQYALELPDVRILFTEARLAESLATLERLPATLRAVVFVDAVPERLPPGDVVVTTLAELVRRGTPDTPLPALRPQDVGGIAFTSGTTGKSKGVVSPHLQAVVMAREAAQAFALTPRDRLYTCLPLFHGMASVTTCLAAMYAGATIVLSPQFSVSRFWDELRESGATQFNALGSMLQMLLTSPASPLDRRHAVTRVFAAPAPADVLYRFESRHGVHVIEGYGQTEIKNVLYNPLQGRKVGSMGRPTASSLLEIHDEDGNTLPPGEIGEIVYRPRIPHVMLKHYHRDPEATLEGMHGLWWHTGDLGSMDADGFFYFFDRKKDSLRRHGENISSHELEAAVAAFPGIAEAAAIAAPREELLVAFEAAGGAAVDLPALFQHCVRTLPRFMVPRHFRLVAALPRTPTGKVRKAALREDGLTADTWDALAAGLTVPR